MGQRTTVTIVVVLAGSGLAAGVAAASKHIGPVPAKVFAHISQDFTLKVGHAEPTVSERAAIRDALYHGEARGPIVGVSLARVRNPHHSKALYRSGRLVWLVAINPKIHPPSTCPHGHVCRHPPRFTYWVTVVDAHSGPEPRQRRRG